MQGSALSSILDHPLPASMLLRQAKTTRKEKQLTKRWKPMLILRDAHLPITDQETRVEQILHRLSKRARIHHEAKQTHAAIRLQAMLLQEAHLLRRSREPALHLRKHLVQALRTRRQLQLGEQAAQHALRPLVQARPDGAAQRRQVGVLAALDVGDAQVLRPGRLAEAAARLAGDADDRAAGTFLQAEGAEQEAGEGRAGVVREAGGAAEVLPVAGVAGVGGVGVVGVAGRGGAEGVGGAHEGAAAADEGVAVDGLLVGGVGELGAAEGEVAGGDEEAGVERGFGRLLDGGVDLAGAGDGVDEPGGFGLEVFGLGICWRQTATTCS